MSYKEKRIGFTIIAGSIVFISYFVFAYMKFSSSNSQVEDTKYWAAVILCFIGIGILVTIISQIVFHILVAIAKRVEDQTCDDKELRMKMKYEMVEDEMDKIIALKAMRIGYVVTGLGCMWGLVSLIINGSAVVMLNILFGAFALGSIVEGLSQIYFYRKGV